MEKSRIWGATTIATEFCMPLPGAVHDVIMDANFDDDRLKGFVVSL